MFVLFSVTVLSLVLVYFHHIYSRFSKYGVKHLSVIPPFGNTLQTILGKEHITKNFAKLYNAFPEERFVGRYEFIQPIVVLRDLDLIKKVTIKDFENFIDRRGFCDEQLEPLVCRSLFFLKGQEWKDMRTTLSPAFTSSKIKLMIPFMEEVGKQMMKVLEKNMNESEDKSIEINITDLTTRYATDVIASCAYGLKVDSHTERENEFYLMGNEIAGFTFRHMIVFLFNSVFPKFGKIFKITFLSEKAKQFFFYLIMKTIKERDAHNVVRHDMIQLLMEARKGRPTFHDIQEEFENTGFAATMEESFAKKKQVERAWSDHDLVAQAVVFFLAGFETVSSTMNFALHELALHPDVQKRLADEMLENDIKNKGTLDYNSIQKLTYLDMVVSESLRRWSSLPFIERVCIKDYNLGRPNDKATQDYIVKKGEAVFIPIHSIHINPEYYPNPESFDPERFSESNRHLIQPATYMPFGIGPRNCIGSRFALCEVKILLYQILLKFEVCVTKKTCVPLRLRPDRFTPVLQGGSWLQFRARVK